MMDRSLQATQILVVLLLSACDVIQSKKLCGSNNEISVCNFLISSNPIANFTTIQRLGETLTSCLNAFEKFNWDMAVYCPELRLCGLGLDLSKDYRSFWNRDKIDPARYTCSLIVDSGRLSCAGAKYNIHQSGLFASKCVL